MKISLFYKPYTTKVCLFLILIITIVGMPKQANAGFFSDLFSPISGDTQTAAADGSTDDVVRNSQTVSLMDASINPDMKNTKTPSINSTITENEALSTDNLQGTDSNTNSYISSSDKIITYKVKSGDTLGEIATNFGISKNTILYANTINNNVLTIGQTLIILPIDGVSYTIKSGDTIASIAKTFKADTNDISEYNDNITDKDLQIGDKIIVPGGTIVKKVLPIVTKVEKEQPNKQEEIKPISKSEKPESASPSDITSGSGITGSYIWPFPSGTGRVSQRLHDDNAYDFSAPKGTPIYAIQSGTVLIADNSGYNGGYGLYVVMDFNDGGQAIFGHMSEVKVSAGDVVKQGDIIGLVGSTGRSTGNHVHIGYRGGKPNPYRNLPKGASL
jgi:murein DD-endopeptidase MepM/ murein hydrolase activator NlpD